MDKSAFRLQYEKAADTNGTQRTGKKRKRMLMRQQKKQRQKAVVYFAVVISICAVALSFRVIPYISDLMALRQELVYIGASSTQMRDINPDYVGLLKIDGTTINYPVVRGNDNEQYLNMTFSGEKNRLGAIFMDYRCVGENAQHVIIYGHEASDMDGNKLMFGGLRDFLDEQFLAENPTILFIGNDRISEYEIFSARLTDVNDPAYCLDFSVPNSFQSFVESNGAPADAEQIITLSTCFGAYNDRRVIVQGVLLLNET